MDGERLRQSSGIDRGPTSETMDPDVAVDSQGLPQIHVTTADVTDRAGAGDV